jgi:hypothetical protein
VVDKKRIIRKNGGLRRSRDTRGPWPKKDVTEVTTVALWFLPSAFARAFFLYKRS